MRITVVGAGVVGTAIAHELASRGATVDLIDARGVGLGATRASAGILAPQIEGHIPELRRLASCSLAMYDEFIRRVEQDSGRSVEYHRTGTVQIALDGEGATRLAEDARALESVGVERMLLDASGATRLEPVLTSGVVAALLVPSHGHVRATQLTDALAVAAQARGARVTTAPVIAIEGGPGSPRVKTSEGTIESDAVVVASGSWMVESRPSPAPAVKPIRGQLLHLRADALVASRVIWGHDCYIVPWRDGSVFVGATVEDVGFDDRPTVDGVRELLNAATRLVPSLGGAHLEHVRVGFRPKGLDELPMIGRSETMPGVFYAVGHYRNGVLLAPFTASLLADLVIDGRERPELALVKPGRMTAV